MSADWARARALLSKIIRSEPAPTTERYESWIRTETCSPLQSSLPHYELALCAFAWPLLPRFFPTDQIMTNFSG